MPKPIGDTKTLLTFIRHREVIADALETMADKLRERGRRHDMSKYEDTEFAGYNPPTMARIIDGMFGQRLTWRELTRWS